MLFLCGQGHLAKAYAVCGASPVVDLHLHNFAVNAHKLHPRAEIPQPLPLPSDTAAATTPRDVFDPIFRSPPRARAAGPSSLTFENISAVYKLGSEQADCLYNIVSHINAGTAHSSLLDDLTTSSLTGLKKPDDSIRPIAIGDALARLSARCVCRTLADHLSAHFTAPL